MRSTASQARAAVNCSGPYTDSPCPNREASPRADTPCGGATWPMLEAEPRFWPGLTAGDCLGLVRRYHPASDPAPLLRRLPVPPAAEAAALPPNERKRLALILLLMQRKRVLLLDEPFCGLDAESVFVVQQLILQLGCGGADPARRSTIRSPCSTASATISTCSAAGASAAATNTTNSLGRSGKRPLRGLRKNEYLYEKIPCHENRFRHE